MKNGLKRFAMLTLGLSVALPSFGAFGAISANAESKGYFIRDYSQYQDSANFMVGGYFAPDLTSDAEFQTLLDSGLDFIELNGNNSVTNTANIAGIFDKCSESGMKLLLESNKLSNPDAIGLWNQYVGNYYSGWNRDCVIGTNVWDEPSMEQIGGILDGSASNAPDYITNPIAQFEAAFAGKMFFVNLLPGYASEGLINGGESTTQISNEGYRAYVEHYADTILDNLSGPKVLSIDSYPLRKTGETKFITETYLSDMATAAIVAKNHGADVNYYIQTMDPDTSVDSYRNVEGQADIDMQYSLSMAFGAKQLINFCYETPENQGFQSEAMVTADGTPTNNYTYVKNRIAKVDAMDEAYMQFDWKGVIISKGTTYDRFLYKNFMSYNNKANCYGRLEGEFFANEIAYADSYSATQKANLTKNNLASVTSTETTLVGCFEDDMGYNGYYLANANDTTRSNASTVTMTFDGVTDKVRVYQGFGYTDVDLTSNTLTLHMASGEGVFVVPFKSVSGNQVTLSINGVEETTFVASGENFVLPQRTVDGEIFLGWEYNGGVYPAGYTLKGITSDMTLTAVCLDMDMVIGASVRIDDPYENSIRWTAEADKESLAAVEAAFGASNVAYGVTVISPSKEGSLTIPISRDKFGERVVNGNPVWTLSGVMGKVPDDMLNTEFEGRAFVKVQFADGTQKKFFAAGNNNLRSIAYVAHMAYNDKTVEYGEEAMKRLLVLSLPYVNVSDNNGSLNDWLSKLDKDNYGSLEDWLLNIG